MPEESTKRSCDAAIAGVAAAQHGVVSVQQLYVAGLSSSAIGDRVAAGRLHRVHRGVYAVGHARLSDEGRWMAAVLACGYRTLLSHRSAAELWGMLRRSRQRDRTIDVTVPGEGRNRRGIRVHRSTALSPADSTRRDGIPVTSPARTLADLRRSLPSPVFDRALREAEFLKLPLGSTRTDHTRSELEARFIALVCRH